MSLPQPPPPRCLCPEPDACSRARDACAAGAGVWLRHPRLGMAGAPPAPPPPHPSGGAGATLGHGARLRAMGMGRSGPSVMVGQGWGRGSLPLAEVPVMSWHRDEAGGRAGSSWRSRRMPKHGRASRAPHHCAAPRHVAHTHNLWGPGFRLATQSQWEGKELPGNAPSPHKGAQGGGSPGEPRHQRVSRDALARRTSPPHP